MHTKGSDAPDARASTLRVWLTAGGLAAIGLVLRLCRWTSDELWPDEAFLGYVSGLSLQEILPLTWDENTPPLAHYLVAISERLFGPGEAALRLPSLLAGSLLAPATYLAGRSFLGERTGLFAGIICVFSPIHIFYSQIARAYALLPLLALASGISFHFLVRRGRRIDFAFHSLSAAATIWLHQWGVLLLPCAYLFVIATRVPGGFRRLLLAHGVAALLCLPLLPGARPNPKQVEVVESFYEPVWKATPASLAVPRSLEVLWAGGSYPSATTVKIERGERHLREGPSTLLAGVPRGVWRIGCWLSLVVLTTLGILGVRDRRPAAPGLLERRLLLGLYLLVPLGIGWLVSIAFTPIYLVGRHDVMALPFLALLAGHGASKLGREGGAGMVGLYLVLAATNLIPFYQVTYDEGNRERATILLREVEEGDVVIYTGYRQSPIEYYLRPDTLRGTSLTFPSAMGRWRTGIPTKRFQEDPGLLSRDADETVRKALELRSPDGAIFLVPSTREYLTPLVLRLLGRLGQPEILPQEAAGIMRFQ